MKKRPKIIAVEPELMSVGSGMYIPRTQTIYYDRSLDDPRLEYLKEFVISHETEHYNKKFEKNIDILKHLVHELKEQLKIRFSMKIKKQAIILQKVSHSISREKSGLSGKKGDIAEAVYYITYMLSATFLELISTPLTLLASYRVNGMRFYLTRGGVLNVFIFIALVYFITKRAWGLFI